MEEGQDKLQEEIETEMLKIDRQKKDNSGKGGGEDE